MIKVFDKTKKRTSIWIRDHWVDLFKGEAMVSEDDAWELKHNPDFIVDIQNTPFNKNTWTKKYKKIIWDTQTIQLANGYGSVSEMAIKTLDKLGIDVYTPAKIIDESSQAGRLGEIAKKQIVADAVTIIYSLPDVYDRVNSQIKFGYTMFENTKLPAGWTEKLNNCTGVIAPSQFVKELYISNGVKVPVLKYLHGVNQEYFHWMDRPERDTYTFIDFAAPLSTRKGAELVYKAFAMAFPKNTHKDVRLILKTTEPFWLWGGLDDKRVRLIKHSLDSTEMLRLLFDADCMVFPTHGEGFGLPPLQAMATGLPTLVTNWSGCQEYADKKYCLPLDYTLVESPHWKTGGQWADVKTDDLVDKMRWCYNNRKIARSIGKTAADHVAKEWTWEKRTNDFLDELNNFLQ